MDNVYDFKEIFQVLKHFNEFFIFVTANNFLDLRSRQKNDELHWVFWLKKWLLMKIFSRFMIRFTKN